MAKFSKFIVAAAASLALGAAQADVVIDLFNGTQGPVTSGTSDNSGTMQYAAEYGPDNTVAGLYRDIGVQKTGTGNVGGVNGVTSLEVENGSLNWAIAGNTRSRAIVRWDGLSGTTAGANTAGTVVAGAGPSGHYTSNGLDTGLGLNLDANDSFQFDVLFSDVNFNFWLELYDANGNYSKIKFEAQSHINSTSTPIPIAAFIGQCLALGGPGEYSDAGDLDNDDVIAGACSAAAFDPTQLTAIQFIMETKDGCNGAECSVDLAISAVNVVPEPGALALVGLGLLGAAGAGARRRRTV